MKLDAAETPAAQIDDRRLGAWSCCSADRGTRVLASLNRPFVVGFFLTFGGLAALALGAAISSLVTIWIYVAFACSPRSASTRSCGLERHGTKRHGRSSSCTSRSRSSSSACCGSSCPRWSRRSRSS
jgi:hypothetical protein